MKERQNLFGTYVAASIAALLTLTAVFVNQAGAQAAGPIGSGTTEYFNHAEFKAKAGRLNLITFDDLKIGNGALKGNEYAARGLTIVQRDGHPVNVLRAPDNRYYHPTNFNSQPNGISSASGVNNADWRERSDHFDFVLAKAVNAAGLWVGNVNGKTEIQFLSADQCVIATQRIDGSHKNLIRGPSPDPWDNRIFYGITTDHGIERIRVINPAHDSDGIVLDDIQFGSPAGKRRETRDQSIRIFAAVPTRDSAAFKSATHKALRIVSPQNWDPVPYHVTKPFTSTLTAKPGQRFFLAGDAPGKMGWSLDNFLLVEIESPDGVQRLVIGDTVGSPVEYQGQRLKHIEPQSSSFSPESIELSRYFPKNAPFRLTISALDFGGLGRLSDLFLVAREASLCPDAPGVQGATPKAAGAKSAYGAAESALP